MKRIESIREIRSKLKDGKVSIYPEDISEIKEFSKLKKEEQKVYLSDKYNLNINKLNKIKLDLNLSHEEILNRDYYKGRFGSILDNKRTVYNWDEVSLS